MQTTAQAPQEPLPGSPLIQPSLAAALPPLPAGSASGFSWDGIQPFFTLNFLCGPIRLGWVLMIPLQAPKYFLVTFTLQLHRESLELLILSLFLHLPMLLLLLRELGG